MSFILFSDNDKYCGYIAGEVKEDLKSVLCVDSVWGVILHWWCSAEREASRDENAFIYRFLLAACARILQVYTLPKCTLHLTTAPSSTWFIVLLIHCCIYCIHCWNYALLSQSKQAEQMKSSDIVALIIPIRFLPSSLPPALPPTSNCFSSWMSCGQWPSNDRQIITLHSVCQVSRLFTGKDRESREGD